MDVVPDQGVAAVALFDDVLAIVVVPSDPPGHRVLEHDPPAKCRTWGQGAAPAQNRRQEAAQRCRATVWHVSRPRRRLLLAGIPGPAARR